MATYVRLGRYLPEAMRAVSSRHTYEAESQIKKKAALTRLPGISCRSVPAMGIETFGKLMAERG